MGDTKASSEDGKSRFVNWFKIGSNQGSSSCKPPPTYLDDEENDEPENDEARDYFSEDRQKPKYTALDPKTKNGLSHGKDHAVETPQGGNSTTKLCAVCKLDIGQGTYKEFMGAFFHPQCFICRSCGRSVADHESSASGSGYQYHKFRYDESSYLRCDVCRRFIPLYRFGPIRYRSHPFWSQKYCLQHDYDDTSRCCGCERLQPWDAAYVSLGDGRKLCSECKEIAMMDIGECQPLYYVVREFFEGMRMQLDQPVTVHLMDRQALNQALIHAGIYPMPQIIGHSITRSFDIVVLLLYGMPRLALGAKLVGELTGQWLRLKGYYQLPPELVLAIRQVVACLWLESKVKSAGPSSKKGPASEAEAKFGEFFMNKIYNPPSPALQGVFRETKAAVVKHGLRQTLDHFNRTGFLPW